MRGAAPRPTVGLPGALADVDGPGRRHSADPRPTPTRAVAPSRRRGAIHEGGERMVRPRGTLAVLWLAACGPATTPPAIPAPMATTAASAPARGASPATGAAGPAAGAGSADTRATRAAAAMQVTRAVATVSAAASNATATRVAVGGYQCFIRCTGQGSPTAVLDAGAGATPPSGGPWSRRSPGSPPCASTTAPTAARATRDRSPTLDSGWSATCAPCCAYGDRRPLRPGGPVVRRHEHAAVRPAPPG